MIVSPGGVKVVRRAPKPTVAQLASVAVEPVPVGGTDPDGESYLICSTWEEVRRAVEKEVGGSLLYGRAAGGSEVREFTRSARLNMRWTLNALPWDEVPGRLGMVTLTYPDKWRELVPDGRTLKTVHLRRYRERWTRQFGPMIGAWAMEFQARGAPHLHTYVGLPPGEIDDFRDWARDAWWRVVGSGDPDHRRWGVDVRPCTYGSAEVNAARVADYFWRESGKERQKVPPEGFGNLGRFWGYWGMTPRYHEQELSREQYVAIRRPVRTLQRKAAGRRVQKSKKSSMDGCYAIGVDGVSVGVRLLRWAEEHCNAGLPDLRPAT